MVSPNTVWFIFKTSNVSFYTGGFHRFLNMLSEVDASGGRRGAGYVGRSEPVFIGENNGPLREPI